MLLLMMDLKLALEAHESGRLEDAEKIYASVLQREPGNFDALYLMGVFLGQIGRIPEAAASLANAVAVDPKSSEARFSLGLALDLMGQPAEALAHYDACLDLAPPSI